MKPEAASAARDEAHRLPRALGPAAPSAAAPLAPSARGCAAPRPPALPAASGPKRCQRAAPPAVRARARHITIRRDVTELELELQCLYLSHTVHNSGSKLTKKKKKINREIK